MLCIGNWVNGMHERPWIGSHSTLLFIFPTDRSWRRFTSNMQCLITKTLDIVIYCLLWYLSHIPSLKGTCFCDLILININSTITINSFHTLTFNKQFHIEYISEAWIWWYFSHCNSANQMWGITVLLIIIMYNSLWHSSRKYQHINILRIN